MEPNLEQDAVFLESGKHEPNMFRMVGVRGATWVGWKVNPILTQLLQFGLGFGLGFIRVYLG
ncbi:hypothetical protein C1H46_024118 [Malus baccata]|uniref:Uncharacterized protein n=1 Tax=Malus baccata TaxID=106549 RepID=A0A540LUW4_MALBA|nr:hypothetical protein C1H46_024118 [Malus baccata]